MFEIQFPFGLCIYVIIFCATYFQIEPFVMNASVLLKKGLGGRIGSGQQPFPWCHIEDVVGLYIHALENRTVFGPLNVVRTFW